MKLIIISVPNNIDDNDIKQACAEFAEVLELPTLKVNVLDEADIEIQFETYSLGVSVKNTDLSKQYRFRGEEKIL